MPSRYAIILTKGNRKACLIADAALDKGSVSIDELTLLLLNGTGTIPLVTIGDNHAQLLREAKKNGNLVYPLREGIIYREKTEF